MTLLRSPFPFLFPVKRKISRCPSHPSLFLFPFREYSITELSPFSFPVGRRYDCLVKSFLPNQCGCSVGVNSVTHSLADGELTIVLKKKDPAVWKCLEKENGVEEKLDATQVDRPFLVLFHPATKKVCIVLQCAEGYSIQYPQIGKVSSQTTDSLHPTASLLLQWRENNADHALEQKITICADVEVTSAACSVIVLLPRFHHS